MLRNLRGRGGRSGGRAGRSRGTEVAFGQVSFGDAAFWGIRTHDAEARRQRLIGKGRLLGDEELIKRGSLGLSMRERTLLIF